MLARRLLTAMAPAVLLLTGCTDGAGGTTVQPSPPASTSSTSSAPAAPASTSADETDREVIQLGVDPLTPETLRLAVLDGFAAVGSASGIDSAGDPDGSAEVLRVEAAEFERISYALSAPMSPGLPEDLIDQAASSTLDTAYTLRTCADCMVSDDSWSGYEHLCDQGDLGVLPDLLDTAADLKALNEAAGVSKEEMLAAVGD